LRKRKTYDDNFKARMALEAIKLELTKRLWDRAKYLDDFKMTLLRNKRFIPKISTFKNKVYHYCV